MQSNITRVAFGTRNAITAPPLWQYDYGQMLVFTDLTLPDTYETHFAQEGAATSYTVLGDENGVAIPDILLQSAVPFNAYLYLHAGANDGETEKVVHFPVNARSRPDNGTPTPVQQDVITEAIAALNAGVEAAEDAQEAIENMSVSAETLAAGSDATVTKTTEQGVVHLAFGIPHGAQGETGPAGADGHDGAPGQDGRDGQDGQDGKDGTDGYSPTATVTKSGDTATISITDKNGTTTATVSDGTTPTIDDALSDSSENPVQNKVIVGALNKKADGIIATATGAVASFADGADGLPVHDLTIGILPVQSGEPSPENILPITGWTGAHIYHDDEYDAEADPALTISWQDEAGTVYGGTLDVTSGVLTATWTKQALGRTGWTIATNGNSRRYLRNFIGMGIPDPDIPNLDALCTHFERVTEAEKSTAQFGTFRISDSGYMVVYDNGSTLQDNNAFMSWLDAQNTAGTPVEICYRLATPTTYQITPQQIATLFGDNAIWADTGDTTVQYYADTKTYVDGSTPTVPVTDVQINGTSVVSGGVANVPEARIGSYGVVSIASSSQIGVGSNATSPIVPSSLPVATFFGLARAAGASTSGMSSSAVGQYPESAKSAISTMLGGSVAVSGSTPSITAKPGIRYVCGECSTLDITTPASGIIDVVFESGSTPTVLTITPPTGMTMKWANGFDPTALEANTVYEINIMDGVYGVVGSWS